MLYYAFNLCKLPLWIDTICHAMQSLCFQFYMHKRILSTAAITCESLLKPAKYINQCRLVCIDFLPFWKSSSQSKRMPCVPSLCHRCFVVRACLSPRRNIAASYKTSRLRLCRNQQIVYLEIFHIQFWNTTKHFYSFYTSLCYQIRLNWLNFDVALPH